mmetsp:Transcript_129598/g.415575  ORF Transcript_129598/g.415575 Transcript_129598/m.415575 type:complete len:304 (+) Transcript_129598:128-1039(+)
MVDNVPCIFANADETFVLIPFSGSSAGAGPPDSRLLRTSCSQQASASLNSWPPFAASVSLVAIGAAALARGAGRLAGRPSWDVAKNLTQRGAAPSGPFPELCVFDLDACLWDKEMYEMRAIPVEDSKVFGDLSGRGEGVVGVMSGSDKISLHEGALLALQGHADGKLPGMRIAVASSADTPFAERVGRAALALLEVVPGLTVWDLLLRDWDGADVNQIGRQPPLSSNKAQTHFPRLRQATGVRFDRMLFFDDCNWGDHIGMVSAGCKESNGRGVVGVRTPYGLRKGEWLQGLDLYARKESNMA